MVLTPHPKAPNTDHGPKPPVQPPKVRQYWKGEEPPSISVLCFLIKRTIEDNRKRREANAARDNEELDNKIQDLLQSFGAHGPAPSDHRPSAPRIIWAPGSSLYHLGTLGRSCVDDPLGAF